MRQDFLMQDGELIIENGDFVIGASDTQHVGNIFLMQMGEFKASPLTGFGATNYLKRTITPDEFKRDLKVQLEYDGYQNPQLDDSEGLENLKVNI